MLVRLLANTEDSFARLKKTPGLIIKINFRLFFFIFIVLCLRVNDKLKEMFDVIFGFP